MRNLLVILFLLLGTVLVAQVNVTPKCDGSVPDAVTAFGINISSGQKIYNKATGQLFVCNTPTVSTATLTTASSNFRDLGDYTQLSNKPSTIVTAITIANANGVSGSSSGGTTPALTISLGAITPTSTTVGYPSYNATGTGSVISLTASVTMAGGDVVFINSGGNAALCKADGIANCPYAFAMCAQASVSSSNSGNFITHGIVRNDSWTWTVGGLVYVSITGTTGNTLTQTAPSAANNVIMPIGVALSATTLFFYGNMNSVEHL